MKALLRTVLRQPCVAGDRVGIGIDNGSLHKSIESKGLSSITVIIANICAMYRVAVSVTLWQAIYGRTQV